jgi:homoaconitase/3-isopropylmalate dehydratase large subunit
LFSSLLRSIFATFDQKITIPIGIMIPKITNPILIENMINMKKMVKQTVKINSFFYLLQKYSQASRLNESS